MAATSHPTNSCRTYSSLLFFPFSYYAYTPPSPFLSISLASRHFASSFSGLRNPSLFFHPHISFYLYFSLLFTSLSPSTVSSTVYALPPPISFLFHSLPPLTLPSYTPYFHVVSLSPSNPFLISISFILQVLSTFIHANGKDSSHGTSVYAESSHCTEMWPEVDNGSRARNPGIRQARTQNSMATGTRELLLHGL
jgi:hypothetical protein